MTKSSRRPRVPSYLCHAPSGRAYTWVRDAHGKRRIVYLGKFDSPESHREYRRVVAEIMSGQAVTPPHKLRATPASQWPTVGDVAARFLLRAESYYRRKDGTPTREALNFTAALRPLLKLYRDVPVDAFDLQDLKTVRIGMIDRGWSRTYINAAVRRILRVFAGARKSAWYHRAATTHSLRSPVWSGTGRLRRKGSVAWPWILPTSTPPCHC